MIPLTILTNSTQDYGPVSLDSVDALTLNWNQIHWLVAIIDIIIIMPLSLESFCQNPDLKLCPSFNALLILGEGPDQGGGGAERGTQRALQRDHQVGDGGDSGHPQCLIEPFRQK